MGDTVQAFGVKRFHTAANEACAPWLATKSLTILTALQTLEVPATCQWWACKLLIMGLAPHLDFRIATLGVNFLPIGYDLFSCRIFGVRFCRGFLLRIWNTPFSCKLPFWRDLKFFFCFDLNGMLKPCVRLILFQDQNLWCDFVTNWYHMYIPTVLNEEGCTHHAFPMNHVWCRQ